VTQVSEGHNIQGHTFKKPDSNTAGIEPKSRISKYNTSSNAVLQVQYKGEGQRVKKSVGGIEIIV
jgi:hypothetical protein